MPAYKLGSTALSSEAERCEDGEHGSPVFWTDLALLVSQPQAPEKLGSSGAPGLSPAPPRGCPALRVHAVFPAWFRLQLCCEARAGPFPGPVLDGCQAPRTPRVTPHPKQGPSPPSPALVSGHMRAGLAPPGLAPASSGASLTGWERRVGVEAQAQADGFAFPC